jgi:hypothetical protein
MADLADSYRQDPRHRAGVFHRPHPDARSRQEPHLASLVSDGDHIALVHQTGDAVDGFVIAALVPAPPVYDPGGLTCLIDDFAVADADLWPTVGRELLDEAQRLAGRKGAVQSVVMCRPRDRSKRSMLLAAGSIVVTEWLTQPIRGEH